MKLENLSLHSHSLGPKPWFGLGTRQERRPHRMWEEECQNLMAPGREVGSICLHLSLRARNSDFTKTHQDGPYPVPPCPTHLGKAGELHF